MSPSSAKLINSRFPEDGLALPDGATVNSVTPSTSLAALEILLTGLCAQAGAKYVGIQPGFEQHPALILFNDAHGSTLAVRFDKELCFESIQQKIEASKIRWKEK